MLALSKTKLVILGVVFLVGLFLITAHFYVSADQEFRTQRSLQEIPQEMKETPKTQQPNQLVVMGMHKSGTSFVTRILMLMGAYSGLTEEGVIEDSLTDEFWERKDVTLLNQWLINSIGNTKGPKWSGYGFSLDQIPMKKKTTFADQAQEIIQQLNQKTTSVIKDPRFSLLLPLWRSVLRSPICVITYRHPILLARSLNQYEGISFGDWLSLWENYTISSLQACSDLPTIFVAQEELDSNLTTTISRIYHQLLQIGVQDLLLPSEDQINSLKLNSKQLNQSEIISPDSSGLLSRSQKKLVGLFQEMFETQSFRLPSSILGELASQKGKQSYATFFHSEDEMELIGVLTLLYSIRQFDQERDMIVLTDDLPNENTTRLLTEFGAKILHNPPFQDYFSENPLCESLEKEPKERSEFHLLRLWQLEDYNKILFLKPGGLIFPRVHEIFSVNEVFGAERDKKEGGLKTHFFILSPDNATYQEMVNLLEMHQKQNTTPTFESAPDCSTRGFLSEYFTSFKTLKIGRPDLLHHDYHIDPPPISHTSSSKCPRPWDLSQKPPDLYLSSKGKDGKMKDSTYPFQSLVETDQMVKSLPSKKRNERCGLPRGCNGSLYRLWWNRFSALDSLFHQKPASLRNHWFDLLRRKQLYYGCSRSV